MPKSSFRFVYKKLFVYFKVVKIPIELNQCRNRVNLSCVFSPDSKGGN